MALNINNNSDISIRKNGKEIPIVIHNNELIHIENVSISISTPSKSMYVGEMVTLDFDIYEEGGYKQKYINKSKFLFEYDKSKLNVDYNDSYDAWDVTYIGGDIDVSEQFIIKFNYPGLSLGGEFRITVYFRPGGGGSSSS